MTSGAHNMGRIVTASTFTSEPIERGLSFWLERLGWPWEIEFAPYNQVFQQLLDPTSSISQNQAGANLILLRFEDWLHQAEGQATAVVEEFIGGLTAATTRSAVPYVICICPPSPQAVSTYGSQFDSFTQMVRDAAATLANVHLLESQDIQNPLPVESIHNQRGEKLGRIPYTEEFFIALAAVIARKLFVIQLKPYKVIVLDCDNTLWDGVVGEDGPEGITITPAHRQFQELLVQQFEAGMLLALCSKNVESDVLRVFEQRPEMPLKLEHLVAWRVNWQPKSQNIAEMAAELQLGVDSFIFIDDNPVECAEVQASCPEVLTLQFPKNEAEIIPVVRNLWAFDRLSITAEDKNRTQMYRENVARNRAQADAPTLGEFLKSLNLQISCAPMRRDQLPRVSQLTQRTNQFNATTIRRSESEVLAFCAEDNADCLTVEVSDRFGDYGLVGAVLYKIAGPTLTVDTFLLSCRVLGRGVEHGIIEKMAQIAADHGASLVEVPTHKTDRNEPVLNFLEQIGSDFKTLMGDDTTYSIPVDVAASCSSHLFQSDQNASEEEVASKEVAADESASTHDQADAQSETSASEQSESASGSTSGASAGQLSTPALLAQIATHLQSVENIKAAIEAQVRPRPSVDEPYVSPQTDLEKSIALIWAKALGIDKIGLNDKFTELGGGSLQIVQIHGQLESATESTISIMQLFTLPTVKSIADYVNTQQNAGQKRTKIQERAQRQLEALKRHRLPRVAVH